MINHGMIEPGRSLTSILSSSQVGRLPAGSVLELRNRNDQPLFRLDESVLSFYPDPSEADQGSATAGGNRTVKDFINTIGSSPAVIVLISTGASNYTDYAVLTDLEIPSNILVYAHHGARFSVPAGVTLTINGCFRAGLYQVFSGDGSIVFGSGAVDKIYASWFGDNTTSTPIQKAVNSLPSDGGEIVFTTAQHTITINNGIGVRIDKNYVRFTSPCKTEFIPYNTDIDGFWFVIGASHVDDSFVKVHDITFDGLKFTGSATSESSTQAAIYSKIPGAEYTPSSDGCSNIRVTNCEIKGFTMSVYLKGAYKAVVDHNEMGDNVYIPDANAGGYCVLAETTYNLKVHHNNFVSGTEDRHAVYVSVDQNKSASPQCKNVEITDNYADWSNTVEGTNGFRNAINVRCVNGIIIKGNIIYGSMQRGIGCDFSDGNGSDYIITDNIITGVRVLAGSTGGGITFIFNDTYNGSHILVKNNILTESPDESTDGFYGVDIAGISDVIVGGNKIVAEANNSVGIIVHDASNVTIEPNDIELNSVARSGIALAATCDNITIHRQDIRNAIISKIETIGSPTLTNIHYAFDLLVNIDSDGSGGITVSEYDGWDWIDSVASETHGCTVTFKPIITEHGSRLIAVPRTSSVKYRYLRSSTDTTQVIGITDINGNHLPLDSNADSFTLIYPAH